MVFYFQKGNILQILEGEIIQKSVRFQASAAV
jgi:hypothetical protein